MKKYTLLFLLIMLTGIIAADVYTIGDGTATQGFIPAYGFYDYGWSRMIYTAAEMSATGFSAADSWLGVGFQVGNNPTDYTLYSQTMYMRHTTASSFTTSEYPNNAEYTQVFTGDLLFAGPGWYYVIFDTPFAWDGSSNIEILWENHDGVYASGYPTWCYTPTTENMAIYNFADTTFPTSDGTLTTSRPNLQLLTPDANLPEAATLIAPADNSTIATPQAQLAWAAPASGAIPTGYKLYLGTTTPPPFVADLGLATTYQTDVLPFDTVHYWQVVPYNSVGDATGCPIWSFTSMPDPTISDFPWTEGFDTYLPPYWTEMSGIYPTASGTSSNWAQDDWLNDSSSGNQAARVNIYGASTDEWLITPPIAIPAGDYELMFDLGLTDYANSNPIEDPTAQEDDKFIVAISDSPDMANPTVLRQWDNAGSAFVYNQIPHTGEIIYIDLSAHSGTKYIAFYGESTVSGGDNDLFVDNVTVRETPTIPILSYNPASIDFGMVEYGVQTGPQNLTLSNDGSGTLNLASTDISISGPNADEFSFDASNLPAALGLGESVIVPVYVTGSTEGLITATLTINYDGTNYDVPLSAEVLSAGIVTIGDGTADNRIPVHPYYGYTYSQSIFLQSEINISNQRIEKIWYYWNGAGATQVTNDWVVYMGHTTSTELTDWIPVTNLSQVFSGVVAAPAVEGWVEITLDAPFFYNNVDNLVIAVDENTPGYDSSGWYYYSTASDTNRSIRYYNDSTNPDPTAPPAGTLVAAYPNVMLQFGDVPTGPPDPVTLVYPEDGATDLPIDGFNLTWIPALTGGVPETYTVYMSTSESNIYMDHSWDGIVSTSFDPTQAASDPLFLGYEETWYWTVKANNANGSSDLGATDIYSFTTMPDPRILSLPYSQNFDGVEAPELPAQWIGMVNPSSTSYYVNNYSSTTYSVSPPNTVKMYNSSSTTADIRLISPEILVPMNTIKLSFSARGSSSCTLLVGTVNTNDETGTFNQLASLDLTTTHTVYTLSLASYTGTDQYICFQHGLDSTYRSIYIDDVSMEELVPNDLAVTSFGGDTMGILGDELSYQVSVYNNGTATQNAYDIQLLSVDSRTLLATLNVTAPLAAGATAEHSILWTPAATGVYDVYAKVVLTGDVNTSNDESDIVTVGVYPATSFMPFVGDIESTSTSYYTPFTMYYKNSLAETIYLAPEMQMTSGTISAIIYHNDFTQDLNNIAVKIWMQNTTESVNAAWLPYADYTLVFDGSVSFPAGINSIAIPLQTPFEYTGGNLAVRTNRVMDTQYYSSSDKFYYTLDANYPNRTRYYYNDSTEIDPTDPSVTAMGTQSNYIPNTGFIVNPASPVTALAAPELSITHDGTEATLSWDAIPYAYCYQLYASADPYIWDSEPIAVYANEVTVPTTEHKTFFKVVAQSYAHEPASRILNPAAVLGFNNSSLRRNARATIGTENKD